MTFPFPFFIPSGASMPPGFLDLTHSGSASGVGSTGVTLSHTTTAATSAIIILVNGSDQNTGAAPTIAGATFDGVAATIAVQNSSGASSFDGAAAILHLFNPGAKTADVVVTFTNANVLLMHVTVINVEGVSSYIMSGSDIVNATQSVDLTVPGPSFQVGVACSARLGAPTYTWSAGTTEMLDMSPTGGANTRFSSAWRAGTGAETYTMQATPTSGTTWRVMVAAAYG